MFPPFQMIKIVSEIASPPSLGAAELVLVGSMRALIPFIALLCLVACASSQPSAGSAVAATEARRQASTYMLCVLGIGCGGVGKPVPQGEHWAVPVLAGIAADPQHPHGWIHVDRSSGLVSYSKPLQIGRAHV